MTKDWHYAWQGQSHGPVSDEALEDLIRAGRVRPETLIWSEGMVNWEPASNHFAFGSAAGAPPPMPAQGYASSYASSTSGGLYAAAPPRGFVEAIKVCFSKYATFRGRASRSEYWYFTLFTSLLGGFGSLLETGMGNDGSAISALFGIATFLPSLAVTVRRLHDTDHSGWWIGGFYLGLILGGGLIGGLVAVSGSGGEPNPVAMLLLGLGGLAILGYMITLLIFMVRRGTPGPNRFG